MCGISFILDKRFILDEQPIRQMNRYLQHRGPDNADVAHLTNNEHQYFLGANRLMIIDRNQYSNQPFSDDQQSAVLIFNGEIYNFFDLKNRLLEYAVHFKTQSDTEVLFHWLKIFGKSGLADLEGMFSFVFLNCQNHSILIARDRFGMKPLYYFDDSRYFMASSEAKGILASGLVEKSLNANAVHHYLNFRYSNKPHTFFNNIEELPAGCFISIDVAGKKESGRFHQFNVYRTGKNYSIEAIEGMIHDSFLKHIYAKSNVGLMLSGGVDSSLLLAMAHQENINLPAFSVINAKKDRKSGTSDYKYAEWIAKRFGAEHYALEIPENQFEYFSEWVTTIDQPVADSGAWMTYLLSQEAKRQNVNVLLSGAGADELFAGYNRHWAFYQYLRYFKYLVPLSNAYVSLKKMGQLSVFTQNFRHLDIFLTSIDANKEATYLNFLKAPFQPLNTDDSKNFVKPNSDDPFSWSLHHDMNNYLVHDVLSMSDQMSMQSGVEVRMPYLDNALSSYLTGVYGNILIEKGKKWILKNMLKKYDVGKIAHRSKQGFGMPLAKLFRNKKDFGIWDLFQKENSIIFNFIDRKLFNMHLAAHKQGKVDNSQTLWSALLLGHWLKQEFE